MAEVLFYHLTATPLDRTLPDLLEKSLARGWRVLLRCGTQEGLAALGCGLWGDRGHSFPAHGPARAAGPGPPPVLLTLGAENANAAEVLMLVEGARATVAEMSSFFRVCLLFDGGDAAAVEAARAVWREVAAAGLTAVYWAQEDARWVRKAVAGG